MHISGKELRDLASEVDDLHHEAMRDFQEQTAEIHLSASQANRRRFLKHAGAMGAGGALLVAGSGFGPTRGLLGLAAAQSLDDETIAGYAQSVELAAVAAYDAAGAALTDATKPVATLFKSHHQQHADAFGGVAGDKATDKANAKLIALLTPTLEGINDEKGALELAFTVENQAAYTYAAALTLLQDAAYAKATSTILPIESQHAVVLGLALGKSVTDVFPTGAFESAALGDGTNPKAGLDPAVFAG